MSISDAHELTEAEIIDEENRCEKIREKYKYLCIAFDGDHPQIAATEHTLIPRSISKNLVFLKWAGGCSMTQSPNDNNRGMHRVLKNYMEIASTDTVLLLIPQGRSGSC